MNIDSIQSTTQPQQSTTRTPASVRQVSDVDINNQRIKSETSQQQSIEPSQKAPSLEEAVKHLADFVASASSEISFSIDQSSGTQVVKIMDKNSHDVIRQIPSEEAIHLAQALDKLQGLFVKDKA
jgi:flagellar protein FlaG